MALKENPNYAVHKVHQGIGSETNSSNVAPSKHGFFYTEGEYPFGELDLIGYPGWMKISPSDEENNKGETIASIERGENGEIISSLKKENYNKTLIYENKNERVLAVMYLDLYNKYHELDVSARDSPDGTIEKTVYMLERELKCKWKPRAVKEETSVSSLVDKLEEN